MVAIFVVFAEPELADHAAVGKNFLHSRGLLVEGPPDRILPIGRVAVTIVAATIVTVIIVAVIIVSSSRALARRIISATHHVGCRQILARRSIEQHAHIPYTHG
jgi:hypothetical protein